MELQFLGTGAGVPAKHRNVSGIALKLLDERNAVGYLTAEKEHSYKFYKVIFGLEKLKRFLSLICMGIIFSGCGLAKQPFFQGGNEALEIYGPVGVAEFVKTALRVSQTRLAYPLKFIELTRDSDVIFQDKQFTVRCKPLDHGIISFGYRVEEKDHEGELQVDKLQAIGIPFGPLYGKMKRGETIHFEGQELNGREFVGTPKPGRIVTILGDTRKTKNSITLAENADVLVHESTLIKKKHKWPGPIIIQPLIRQLK